MLDFHVFENLALFIKKLLNHWIILTSGPVLAILLGIYEHYTGTNVSWKTYSLILAIAFLPAIFFVWRDEYMEVLTLLQSNAAHKSEAESKNKRIAE